MRHIISILLQNEAGALARVAGMFSARGYNIESLTVAPTHDPLLSRLTLVTTGSDEVIEQIVKQSRKLIDIVDVQDLTAREHIEYELALVKLRVTDANAAAVIEAVRRYRGLILDESDDTRTVQVTGSGPEVSEAVEALQTHAPILEIVRSGVAAIQPGADALGAEVALAAAS